MENTVLQIRIDKKLKENSIKLYNDIGLDISTAIRLFLSKSLIDKGLPFDLQNVKYDSNNIKLKCKEDLNKFMINDNNLYNKISVDKYLKESRDDSRQ